MAKNQGAAKQIESLDEWLQAEIAGKLAGRGARGGMAGIRRRERQRRWEEERKAKMYVMRHASGEKYSEGVYKMIASEMPGRFNGDLAGCFVVDLDGRFVHGVFGPKDSSDELTLAAWAWYQEHITPNPEKPDAGYSDGYDKDVDDYDDGDEWKQ